MSNEEQWEYLTTLLRATPEDNEILSRQQWPDWRKSPKYPPEALMPELNKHGRQGWELVHIEPVMVGGNGDVSSPASTTWGTIWAKTYFCVFKRRIRV